MMFTGEHRTIKNAVAAMAALAQVYVTFEGWKEALKYGEMLRIADPQNPWGLYAMGAALTGQGQPEKAADVLAPLMASGTRRAEFAKAYADALAALNRP